MTDTYQMPKHGWTCFFCGETFQTVGGARDHFGATPISQPGCLVRVQKGEERGLLIALRKAEEELERYRCEDSDKDREMSILCSTHAVALRKAEEDGYAKGLRDRGKIATQDCRWRPIDGKCTYPNCECEWS